MQEISNERKKELKEEAKEVLEQKEKQKKPENSIKVDVEKSEKVKEAFDKIEFLSLTNEEKKDISVSIKENAKLDKLYIIELAFSVLIATLWLLQNSVAVVVWAMIIAPIIRPINGLSYSIARWWQLVFKKSFFMLLVSFFLSIALAFLTTKILWLNVETSEILSRTNPNLIDFFIAIFSGAIWIMSIKFTRLWSWLAWVAMAVALVPPLSVIGIEIALNNYSSAFWAFLLFLTNILAIWLISTIFLWLYGFTPHNKDLQSKVFRRLMIFLFSLILILIPLSFSYINILNYSETSMKIEKSLDECVVSKVSIIEETDYKIKAKVVLKILESTKERDVLEIVREKLKKDFPKKLELEFEFVKVLEI